MQIPILLTDASPMPFGKYRGKAMIEVPAQYLLWLYNNGCDNKPVMDYISSNMDALKKEAGVKK